MIMKIKLFISLLAILLTTACTKDHVLNSDYNFKDLSSKSGVWHLVSLQETQFNADGTSVEVSPLIRDDVYWVFYIESEDLGQGSILETKKLAIYQGAGKSFQVLGRYTMNQIIKDRITIIINYKPIVYRDYTIEEQSNKKLILNRIEISGTKQILHKFEFEKCKNCDIPYSTNNTNIGG